MNLLDLLLMQEQPAIQNLDFLRQLISESRGQVPMADMEKLRMFQGSGMGTSQVTNQQRD